MIQRIQTAMMGLALIACALLFVFPFFGSEKVENTLLLDGSLEVSESPILMTLTGIAAVLIAVAIILFKNRPMQMRINTLSMLFILAVPMVAYFTLKSQVEPMPKMEISTGTLMPALAVFLLIMANRFIKKDEKLVRSADRLR